jgi:uncharacterized protein (TIGR02594 family)
MNKELPNQYRWLLQEPGPKMLVEALKHYGTLEHRGKDNNPDITAWASEIGGSVAKVYVADEIPWCGLFIAVVAKRADKEVVKDPLWALNWGTFGQAVNDAMLGDVLVFIRRTASGAKAGHVGLYVGHDKTSFHVLGGNQSDSVCITRIAKNRLYAIRRPVWKIAQPPNVRSVELVATGRLSANEA